MRLLRHPSILRFHDGFQKDTDGGPYLMVCEKALPLSLCLKQQSRLQIRLGLQKIVQALDFVVNVAKISDEVEVDTNSIFVTPEGNWKLLVRT